MSFWERQLRAGATGQAGRVAVELEAVGSWGVQSPALMRPQRLVGAAAGAGVPAWRLRQQGQWPLLCEGQGGGGEQEPNASLAHGPCLPGVEAQGPRWAGRARPGPLSLSLQPEAAAIRAGDVGAPAGAGPVCGC